MHPYIGCNDGVIVYICLIDFASCVCFFSCSFIINIWHSVDQPASSGFQWIAVFYPAAKQDEQHEIFRRWHYIDWRQSMQLFKPADENYDITFWPFAVHFETSNLFQCMVCSGANVKSSKPTSLCTHLMQTPINFKWCVQLYEYSKCNFECIITSKRSSYNFWRHQRHPQSSQTFYEWHRHTHSNVNIEQVIQISVYVFFLSRPTNHARNLCIGTWHFEKWYLVDDRKKNRGGNRMSLKWTFILITIDA